MNHVIPVSGKDSLTTYIVQNELFPYIKYQTIFNDTGLELPETYEWLNKVELKLDIKIKRIGESLENIMYEQGILPSPKVRYCTRLSKIYPMEDFFNSSQTTVYFGIRADEPKRTGYKPSKRANIIPKYPLIDLNIGINQVYQILDNADLMPPTFFWQELYTRVREITGDNAIKNLSRFEFDYLFSWRSRPNCFNCFYQRQYELIGLHVHHPSLFEQACKFEDDIGANNFTMRAGYKLKDIVKKKNIIINRRVKNVVKTIMQKSQMVMFEPQNEISLTSCGLFCGK